MDNVIPFPGNDDPDFDLKLVCAIRTMLESRGLRLTQELIPDVMNAVRAVATATRRPFPIGTWPDVLPYLFEAWDGTGDVLEPREGS